MRGSFGSLSHFADPHTMLEELRNEYSMRLKSGESPESVWSEIELFYTIRQTFHLLDPGKIADFAPDEYDGASLFFLRFLEQFAKTGLSISHHDLEDLAVAWIPKHFKGASVDLAKDFAYELYCELITWRDDQILIKGSTLPLLREMPES